MSQPRAGETRQPAPELRDALCHPRSGHYRQPPAVLVLATALLDLLQVLHDDMNLQPLYQVASKALAPTLVDGKGEVVQRGTADALVEVQWRAPGGKWRAPKTGLSELLGPLA